ncbi:unnamed protein product [Ambrosiozyma monospora]|uniref:UDP-N-acetylglucosamine transferase subunit ALG13 n=1 Tax=Ambrosiozyma monospora TaxID=43982 RepID=A0A9W7DI94_AMBMO|nr:unnamed protein product [Ambrosiozyma monospora]
MSLKQQRKQLLVTTGATVTFSKLIELTLHPTFLQLISTKLQYTHLVVQYGTSNDSQQLVDKLLSQIPQLSNKKPSFKPDGTTTQTITFPTTTSQTKSTSQQLTLEIKCMVFDTNLVANYTAKSHLVISHAGTGSILDTLRCPGVRLLVVINSKLLDNHQLDIAEAFADMGVLKFYVPFGDDKEQKIDGQAENKLSDVGRESFCEFLELVSDVDDCEFKKIETANGSVVEDVILSECN